MTFLSKEYALQIRFIKRIRKKIIQKTHHKKKKFTLKDNAFEFSEFKITQVHVRTTENVLNAIIDFPESLSSPV